MENFSVLRTNIFVELERTRNGITTDWLTPRVYERVFLFIDLKVMWCSLPWYIVCTMPPVLAAVSCPRVWKAEGKKQMIHQFSLELRNCSTWKVRLTLAARHFVNGAKPFFCVWTWIVLSLQLRGCAHHSCWQCGTWVPCTTEVVWWT